jgi:hypothetical protein
MSLAISNPDCVFTTFDTIYEKYPDLNYKEVLDMSYSWCEERQEERKQGKDFICSDFWDFVDDQAEPLEEAILQYDFYNYLGVIVNDFLTEDAERGAGAESSHRSGKIPGARAGSAGAITGSAKRKFQREVPEGKEILKKIPELFEVGSPESYMKVGEELIQIPTLQTPAGSIRGRATMYNRPLTPVMSSVVMGRAVRNSNLYVQFHSNPGKIYKYSMASPEVALEAFEEIARESPGRYVWNNLRGRTMGPVFGRPSRQTPGGTSASLVPYDKLSLGRVKRFLDEIPGYEELSEKWREYKMAVKGEGEGATSGEPFTVGEIKAFQEKLQAQIEEKKKILDEIRAEFSIKGYKDVRMIAGNDLIVSDFITVNDTTLGGYVVRDGPFRYGDQVRFKTWRNIKNAYGDLKQVIAYGSQQKDSHTEREDRFIGYWDNFKFIPKGTMGDYEPYIDYKYNRVQAKLHTKKPLEEISSLKEYKRRPVSASYEDLGTGNEQIIGEVYHIAVSLDANEQDRCDTENGTPCGVYPDTHDHLHNDTVQAIEQLQNGVLRADFSQPPNNKKEIDDNMGKKEKKMEEKEYDNEEENDKEMDMKTEDSKKVINGVVMDTPAEGDDDRIEDKIMGSNLFGTEHYVQKCDFNDLSENVNKLTDMFSKITPLIERIAKKEEDADNKLRNDLLETLTQDPYNFPKEKIQDFSVERLQEQKDLVDSLPMIQDYKRSQPLTHEDVNKHFTDFEIPQTESPALRVLQKYQGIYNRNISDMGSISKEGD